MLNQLLDMLHTYHVSETLIASTVISEQNLEEFEEFLLFLVRKGYS